MEKSDVNYRGAMKPPPGFSERPVEGVNDGNNRRALRDIRNLMAAPPLYPTAIHKRGLQDKHADDENARALAAKRRFAATGKSQSCAEEETCGTEIHEQPFSTPSNALDEPVFIDVDYYKMSTDMAWPIAEDEENTETEMEDTAEGHVLDIDSNDYNNPLAVVNYVDDIYRFYRKMEVSSCISPYYMLNQFDINEKMRAILVDWLIEVHYKFELMDETLYLTVNIIDRFLAQQPVVRKKLQLVGVTAMLLACKYEEIAVPVVEDLIMVSDRAYTREEVLEMEKRIVNTLQFNMSLPTSYVFMRRFLKAAQADKKLEHLSFFMIELCLVQYEMLKFRPSILAAAAIYTAQCTMKGLKQWTKTSVLHTCYTQLQLQECSKIIVGFHKNAETGKLTAVYRKYNTFKFGFAANCQPALFMLDERF